MNSKILLAVLQITIFISVVYFICVNYFSKTISTISISFADTTFIQVPTALLILFVYTIAIITFFISSISVDIKYKDQIAFYARRTEKLSQQNEIDTDDKEALQRKIASLEIALNNALQNNEK